MRTNFLIRVLFSVLLLSSLSHALAQDVGAKDAYDHYPTIKDKPLHDAMNVVMTALSEPITGISKLSPEYKPDTRTSAEKLSGSEAIQAMRFLLDYMAMPDLAKHKESLPNSLYVMLGEAIRSGNPEFLPGLKKLAPVMIREIRGELLNAANYLGEENQKPGSHYNPPHPQLDLMKDMVRLTLEQMPSEKSISEEFVTRREDFITAVRTFCLFSTLKERGEIIPYVEKFLTKYDLGFEQFYRPRLYRNLQEKSLWSGIRKGSPEEGTWQSIHGRQPSRAEKLAWIAGGILAGVFALLLWLRRRRTAA